MKWAVGASVPKYGDIRWHRKFAWWPTQCGAWIVWLEVYEQRQRWDQIWYSVGTDDISYSAPNGRRVLYAPAA